MAGGASRRMGTDKAFLELDGQPLVVRITGALVAAGSEDVFVVGGAGPRLAALGLRCVPDRWPGEGPLGALITALAAARYEAVVVLAADLAVPDPTAVGALVAASRASSPVVVPRSSGRAEVLQAAYRRSLFEDLVRVFQLGERSIVRALARLDIVPVEVSVAPSIDLDTPEDLAAYLAGRAPEASRRPWVN